MSRGDRKGRRSELLALGGVERDESEVLGGDYLVGVDVVAEYVAYAMEPGGGGTGKEGGRGGGGAGDDGVGGDWGLISEGFKEVGRG